MAYSQPTVFLSHGGGPSLFMDAKDIPMMKGLDKHSAAADFLQNFTQTTGLRKPRAILVLSAHWDEQVCTVNTKRYHSLYRDYGNFGPGGNVTWPAPGAPEVAGMAKRLLQLRGIQCAENDRRGLDHGVFVPLKLVFPKADIPVCQLSLQSNLDIQDHLRIGEALGDLGKQGVLVIGSGFASHNLGGIGRPGAPVPDYIIRFQRWLNDLLLNPNYTAGDRKKRMIMCESTAPELQLVHGGRIDHFLPLLMCSAAAGYRPGKLLYSDIVLQTLINEHYLFPTI